MDNAVEQVEWIFGHIFSSHLTLGLNRIRRGGRLFETAATRKPALAATTRPKSISRYAP
jgi:hypothetical protein